MLGSPKVQPRPGAPLPSTSRDLVSTQPQTTTLTSVNSTNNSELEAEEIIKYIKDAYQIPKLISATDLVAEEEQLKIINAKKVPSLLLNTETLSRGEAKFTTQVSNTNLAYKKKLARRTGNMRKGFFSRQGQPYASVGEVYTCNAALLQSTLMTDVINKMKFKASHDSNCLDAILAANAGQSSGSGVTGSGEIDVAKTGLSGLDKSTTRSTRKSDGNKKINKTIQNILIGKVLDDAVGASSASSAGEPTTCTAKTTQPVQLQSTTTAIAASLASDHQNNHKNEKKDSGINQIRQKLSHTKKMRTDVSGGIDLLTSLDELQYKEKILNYNENGNDELNDDLNDGNASQVSKMSKIGHGSHMNGNAASKMQFGKNKKGPGAGAGANTANRSGKTHQEPWRNIKSRKQMIKDIADNQMKQLAHEAECLEAINNPNATLRQDSNDPNNNDQIENNKNAQNTNQHLPKSASLRTKQKNAWAKVRTIGKIVHATRNVTNNSKDSSEDKANSPEIERENLAKIRYLTLISQLLSALYNMKKNSVKSCEPLTELEVKELLRVQSAPPLLLLFLHDQGIAKIDPNIVRDFEPSSIEEFSGAMRFSANISEIDKNWRNVPKWWNVPHRWNVTHW